MDFNKLKSSSGIITPSSVGSNSNSIESPLQSIFNKPVLNRKKEDNLAASILSDHNNTPNTFLDQTPEQLEEYSRYGAIYSPYADMNKVLAEHQGKFNQLFNAFVMQGFVGVGLIGTAEGFTDLYDLVTGAAFRSIANDVADSLDDGSENFSKASDYMYRNAASKWLHEKRDDINKRFAVYSDKEYTMGNGGLLHWGWYMQNLPSLWSFASFMIPSGIVTKGLSFGVKGIKAATILGKTAKALDKAEDVAKGAATALELDNAAANVGRAVTAYREANTANTLANGARAYTGISQNGQTLELLTNGILGTFMANQTFARDIAYQKEQELRANFKDENYYAEVLKNNPSLLPIAGDKEKVIRVLANRAATRDWEWNIITGIPLTSQLYAIRGWWKGFANKGGTRKIIGAARQQAENFAKTEEKAAIDAFNNSVRSKVSHFFTDRDFSWGSNFRGYWDAAWGNAVNVIGELEADYDLTSNLSGDKSSVFERLPEHFSQGRLYDAAVWGALGGVFSNKLMSKIGSIKQLYFDKVEKTEEQSRLDDINSWTDRVQATMERMRRIKNGENIFKVATDKNGNKIKNPLFRGEKDTKHTPYLYDKFETDAEKEYALKREYNNFLLSIADEAASHSNLRYLKAFINDERVRNAFVDENIISQEEANDFSTDASQILDEFEKVYNAQINRTYEAGITPQLGQIIASENTKAIFDMNYLGNLNKRYEDTYNKLISDYINSLPEDERVDAEKEIRRKADIYRDALIINQVRIKYRNRLNQLSGEKGRDVEIERKLLKKIVDNLDKTFEKRGYSQEHLDTILYFSKRSRKIVFDENGRPKIDGKGNIETTVYDDEANDYLNKRLAQIDDEVERNGYRGILEKIKKSINSDVADFSTKFPDISKAIRDMAYVDLEQQEISSRINSDVNDIIDRANQLYTVVDEKAKEKLSNAVNKIGDIMLKYDPDEVYDYVMQRKDSITDITDEDLKELDEAIFISGLNDEKFEFTMYDIAQKFNEVKEQKKLNDFRSEIKKQNQKAYDAMTANNYTIEDSDILLSPEDKKNLKVGDRVVYQEKLKDPSKLEDEINGRKSDKNNEIPYTYFNFTGTIVEINHRKATGWIDSKTHEVLTAEEADNMTDEQFEKWIIEHNAKEGEYNVPDSYLYTIEKDKDLGLGSKIQVSERDITHRNLGSKPKKTPRTAPKKSSGTKGKSPKKSPAPSKKSKTAPSKAKSSSSTGGIVVNNTKVGGIIEVDDLVNVLDDDGNVVYQGTVTKVLTDGYKIKVEGKSRAIERHRGLVARDAGYIDFDMNKGDESEFDLDDYIQTLCSIDDEGNEGIFYQQIVQGVASGNLLDVLQDIREQLKENKPEEDINSNPLNIDQDTWNKAVDDYIDYVSKNTKYFKKSTLGDLLFINDIDNLVPTSADNISEAYKIAVDRFMKSFMNDIGATEIGSRKVVNIIDVFRYIYNHRKNINDVNDLYDGLINAFKGANKYDKSSGIVYSIDVLKTLNTEELEAIITSEYDDISLVDTEKFDIEQKFPIDTIIENTGANSFEDAMQKINPSSGFNIKVGGDGIHFYSKDKSGNSVYVGSLPQPFFNHGVYELPNDGWRVDLLNTGSGIQSDFLENFVNEWFTNQSAHKDLMDVLTDYIALTVEERKDINIVDSILKRFIATPEYNAAKRCFDTKSKTITGTEAIRRRLDYLRKLFQYSNGFSNKTMDYGVLRWRDKLYNSAIQLTDVVANPNKYEARYVGLNPGVLYYGNREDRGYAQDRIAGYESGNRNEFKLSVSDRNGFVSIAREAFPQRVPFARKGNTFLALPYQGAGFRNYVQAYPVSIDVLENDNSQDAKIAKDIVSDIREQFEELLIENLNNPTSANFDNLKNFLLKVFWNKNNFDSKTKTAYSLFRLKEDSAKASKYKYLTVTDRGNQVTLSVGNERLIVTNERENTVTGKKYKANTFSINGKSSSEVNIIEEISKIFDNIAFDININFIKSDGSKNKSFGTSLVSYDKDGKFVIDTGINIYKFDSYSRFLMDNHLVTFRTKITPNGTNYIQSSNDAMAMGVKTPDEIAKPKIHIKIVSTTDSDIARRGIDDNKSNETEPEKSNVPEVIYPDNINIDVTNDVINITRSDSKNKGFDIAKILMPELETEVTEDFLKSLFPKKVIYDEKILKDNADKVTGEEPNALMDPNTKIVYIGSIVRNSLVPLSTNAATMLNRKYVVKKLIHEQLHNALREISDDGIIYDLQEVYDEFSKAINKPENKAILESIANELNYDIDSYKNILNGALFEDAEHESQNDKLEEFLIETLTNTAVSKAMNNLKAESIDKSNTDSLWHKMITFLLEKVLGISINKGSLYEKEFNSFSEVFSEKISNFAAKELAEPVVTKRARSIRDVLRLNNSNAQNLKSTLPDVHVPSIEAIYNTQPIEFSDDIKNAIDNGYINIKC